MLGGEQQREFYVDLRRPYAPPEVQGLGSGLSLLVHAATGQMSRWRKGGRGGVLRMVMASLLSRPGCEESVGCQHRVGGLAFWVRGARTWQVVLLP